MLQFNYHAISPLAIDVPGEPSEPYGVHMIVETPQGSRNKFNLNEEFGIFQYSRTLRGGMVWPCDFGFVPQTHADDGDPLDVALFIDAPTFPGCLVRVRLLGVIGFVKNGEENDRLVACPARSSKASSNWDHIDDISEMVPRQIREVEAFLKDYNTFEGHSIQLTGWRDATSAFETVDRAMQKWREKHA